MDTAHYPRMDTLNQMLNQMQQIQMHFPPEVVRIFRNLAHPDKLMFCATESSVIISTSDRLLHLVRWPEA